MSAINYYQSIFNLVSTRSVEATVGMLGITDKILRQHLVQELSSKTGNKRFLADPVFESMFPWEKSEVTMESLGGDLLLPSLIEAMDKAKGHRFGKEWFPFRHQLKAWITAIERQKSMIVTSGTGSGKTECFMVPILHDLAKEYEQDYRPLVGVRALFIYPLNALINSQRERLRAWTEAYDDGVRFCLYNGNTEENKHKDQGKYPHEILTRKAMRETPAPILVTNATMLEYMLVRQIDEPIIQKSQGKLRWIVLDEAHTYVGSQAAELSLLLRRVMHTFGVNANDVRFVATSATISDPDGKGGADKQLQEYLANLAGISIDQVVIIGGKRSVPNLPAQKNQKIDLGKLSAIDEGLHFSRQRYEALAAHPVSRKIREIVATRNIPSTVTNLTQQLLELFAEEDDEQNTLAWLDVCSNTSMPGDNTSKPEINAEAFLPIRGHFFHQVITGLWCCVNKNCSAKQDTPLKNGWSFGRVYTLHRHQCDCGAPIYELVFCNDCNAPHLLAMESGGNLAQVSQSSVDEFSLDYEGIEETDVLGEESRTNGEQANLQERMIIAPTSHNQLTYPLSINEEQQFVPPGMDSFDINVIIPGDDSGCSCCEFGGYKAPFYRRNILGTPFYISNTIPLLLEACEEAENANELPSRGRRLITFTDSRQGTARISAKIQQDSERESIRGTIYEKASQNIVLICQDELEADRKKLSEYKEKM